MGTIRYLGNPVLRLRENVAGWFDGVVFLFNPDQG